MDAFCQTLTSPAERGFASADHGRIHALLSEIFDILNDEWLAWAKQPSGGGNPVGDLAFALLVVDVWRERIALPDGEEAARQRHHAHLSSNDFLITSVCSRGTIAAPTLIRPSSRRSTARCPWSHEKIFLNKNKFFKIKLDVAA